MRCFRIPVAELIFMGSLLALQPALADPPPEREGYAADAPAELHRHGLEERLTPEERRELRQDLDSLSREAYPRRPVLEHRLREARRRAIERFRQADINGDRVLDRTELERFNPRAARHFDAIDLNGDGVITPREIAEIYRERLEMRLRR
jgi:EF hand